MYCKLMEQPAVVFNVNIAMTLFASITTYLWFQVSPYVDIIMHTVCLVWANSRYYNTPARIIVILQEIFNLFIEMVWICFNCRAYHSAYQRCKSCVMYFYNQTFSSISCIHFSSLFCTFNHPNESDYNLFIHSCSLDNHGDPFLSFQTSLLKQDFRY